MTGVFLVKSQKTCQDRVQLHEICTCLGHAAKEAQNMKEDQPMLQSRTNQSNLWTTPILHQDFSQ